MTYVPRVVVLLHDKLSLEIHFTDKCPNIFVRIDWYIQKSFMMARHPRRTFNKLWMGSSVLFGEQWLSSCCSAVYIVVLLIVNL